METHGVEASLLHGPPGPGLGVFGNQGTSDLQVKLMSILPVAMLIVTYLAVQFAQWLKVRPLCACSTASLTIPSEVSSWCGKEQVGRVCSSARICISSSRTTAVAILSKSSFGHALANHLARQQSVAL